MPERITPEQYSAVQAQLLLVVNLVRDWDLDGFLVAIGIADTVGPLLNPTLYMRASPNMHFVENLGQAVLKFQQSIREACKRYGVQQLEEVANHASEGK